MPNPTQKTCTKCGATKPIEEFHRRAGVSSGRVSHCKRCKSEAAAARRAAGGEALRSSERERKRRWRSEATESQLQELRERNREWMAAWRRANPEAATERALAWQADNRERYLETRAARRGRYAEYDATYYRRYRLLNPDRVAESKRRRRALLGGSTVSAVDLDALWIGVCPLCGDELDRTIKYPDPLSASVDHIVPLSLGGTHEQANLQWTHLVCNIRKGAKAP